MSVHFSLQSNYCFTVEKFYSIIFCSSIGGYYTIEQTKSQLRIIALNTNYMRHDGKHSQQHSAAAAVRQRTVLHSDNIEYSNYNYRQQQQQHQYNIDYNNNGYRTDGTVSALSSGDSHESQKQWEWLDDVLAKSSRNKETVSFFIEFYLYKLFSLSVFHILLPIHFIGYGCLNSISCRYKSTVYFFFVCIETKKKIVVDYVDFQNFCLCLFSLFELFILFSIEKKADGATEGITNFMFGFLFSFFCWHCWRKADIKIDFLFLCMQREYFNVICNIVEGIMKVVYCLVLLLCVF